MLGVSKSGDVDTKLLDNLILAERKLASTLTHTNTAADSSTLAISAWATPEGPEAQQTASVLSGALSASSSALASYAESVRTFASDLEGLIAKEAAVGEVARDRDILVSRMVRLTKKKTKPGNEAQQLANLSEVQQELAACEAVLASEQQALTFARRQALNQHAHARLSALADATAASHESAVSALRQLEAVDHVEQPSAQVVAAVPAESEPQTEVQTPVEPQAKETAPPVQYTEEIPAANSTAEPVLATANEPLSKPTDAAEAGSATRDLNEPAVPAVQETTLTAGQAEPIPEAVLDHQTPPTLGDESKAVVDAPVSSYEPTHEPSPYDTAEIGVVPHETDSIPVWQRLDAPTATVPNSEAAPEVGNTSVSTPRAAEVPAAAPPSVLAGEPVATITAREEYLAPTEEESEVAGEISEGEGYSSSDPDAEAEVHQGTYAAEAAQRTAQFSAKAEPVPTTGSRLPASLQTEAPPRPQSAPRPAASAAGPDGAIDVGSLVTDADGTQRYVDQEPESKTSKLAKRLSLRRGGSKRDSDHEHKRSSSGGGLIHRLNSVLLTDLPTAAGEAAHEEAQPQHHKADKAEGGEGKEGKASGLLRSLSARSTNQGSKRASSIRNSVSQDVILSDDEAEGATRRPPQGWKTRTDKHARRTEDTGSYRKLLHPKHKINRGDASDSDEASEVVTHHNPTQAWPSKDAIFGAETPFLQQPSDAPIAVSSPKRKASKRTQRHAAPLTTAHQGGESSPAETDLQTPPTPAHELHSRHNSVKRPKSAKPQVQERDVYVPGDASNWPEAGKHDLIATAGAGSVTDGAYAPAPAPAPQPGQAQPATSVRTGSVRSKRAQGTPGAHEVYVPGDASNWTEAGKNDTLARAGSGSVRGTPSTRKKALNGTSLPADKMGTSSWIAHPPEYWTAQDHAANAGVVPRGQGEPTSETAAAEWKHQKKLYRRSVREKQAAQAAALAAQPATEPEPEPEPEPEAPPKQYLDLNALYSAPDGHPAPPPKVEPVGPPPDALAAAVAAPPGLALPYSSAQPPSAQAAAVAAPPGPVVLSAEQQAKLTSAGLGNELDPVSGSSASIKPSGRSIRTVRTKGSKKSRRTVDTTATTGSRPTGTGTGHTYEALLYPPGAGTAPTDAGSVLGLVPHPAAEPAPTGVPYQVTAPGSSLMPGAYPPGVPKAPTHSGEWARAFAARSPHPAYKGKLNGRKWSTRIAGQPPPGSALGTDRISDEEDIPDYRRAQDEYDAASSAYDSARTRKSDMASVASRMLNLSR